MKVISTGSAMAWQLAARIAVSVKSQYIEQEHLLAGIFSLDKLVEEGKKTDSKRTVDVSMRSRLALESECRTLQELLDDYGLTFNHVRKIILSRLVRGSYDQKEDVILRSVECKRMFARAQELASSAKISSFSTLQLLCAIIETPNTMVEHVLEELHVLPLLIKQKSLALADCKGVYATSIETNECGSLDTYCFFPQGKTEAVTMLAGKIIGSGDLINGIGELELCCLLEDRNQLIRGIVDRCGKGDIAVPVEQGLLALFSSPVHAIESAIELQKAIPETDRLKIGLGIMQGDACKRKGVRAVEVAGTSIDSIRGMIRDISAGDILITGDVVSQLEDLSGGGFAWEQTGATIYGTGKNAVNVFRLTGFRDGENL